MISNLILTKRLKNELPNFVENQIYIIKDNKRQTVRSWSEIRLLMRSSSFAIRKEEKGCTTGVLFVVKSSDLTRSYVKIAYKDLIDADDLLMVLNWNFNKEVYVKLERNSPLVNSFRKKGFKRCYDREGEVLLCRSKNEKRFFAPFKGDEDDEA